VTETVEVKKPICPHCGEEAVLVDSIKVYRKSYGNIWLCWNYPQCNSYVGVHKETNEPLGILGNANERFWRKEAHSAFDPLWMGDTDSTRSEAYRKVKVIMRAQKDIHIGEADEAQCKKIIAAANCLGGVK